MSAKFATENSNGSSSGVFAAFPQWAGGHNDDNGLFVTDPPAPVPFNISSGCAGYWDQLSNGMPGSLAHVENTKFGTKEGYKKNTTQDESQRVYGEEKTALWKKQKIPE
ncbi:hypothetical protein C8J57DRAFT_1237176 [Mycena rebaudengoi]|nr:hypothetical protein C8J57DRAFT_1237176 [Mycena rebaudengoi]